MRSATFVQAFQYWLKLTAISVPALFLLLAWHGDGAPDLAGPAGPVFRETTSVRLDAPVVVDVRRRDEWQSGHVEGARNLPLHELVTHFHHALGGELWVHCASGYRAAIAASLLARAHFPVVLVDDEFDRAEAAGMKMVASS